MIRKILFAALLVAFLILKFYDFGTKEVTAKFVTNDQPRNYPDTLWLSHLSMVTPGNPPKYLNWKSSEPMVAGSIGFEFSDASTIKKLLRRENGKIEEKDILKKIEAPKDRKLIDTYVQGHASFKLINLYKIKTNENAFVLLYKNTSNNSLVEINYLNNLDRVKDVRVYTDGADNNFGEPGTEKIFLRAVSQVSKD